jgi:hypothetical protein
MRALVVIIVIINLFACAGTPPSDGSRTGPNTANKTSPNVAPNASDSTKPVKSPHGYIITKDYELGRFGGFIGDCTDDKNWPYFWQCVSENAGNGGFK